MSALFEYIKKIDKKIFVIILESIVLLTIIFLLWSHFSNKLDISYQNLKAAKGEIEILKTKNDNLLYVRDSYMMREKDLEEQLGISNKEVNELKKNLESSLSYIATLEAKVKTGELITVRDSIVYVTKELTTVSFHYNDKWVSLKGENEVYYNNNTLQDVKTTLSNISLNSKLKIGLSDNNKFFVECDNPYITFDNIEGAYVNKNYVQDKKVRFNYGFQMGVGLQYGLTKKTWDVGPYAGFGIGLSF